jgi:hypothetical protein
LRIRDPQLQFGRYDAAGRFLFAAWQIMHVMHGASVIILGFTVMEIMFGVLQSLPVGESIETGTGRPGATIWPYTCDKTKRAHTSHVPFLFFQQ